MTLPPGFSCSISALFICIPIQSRFLFAFLNNWSCFTTSIALYYLYCSICADTDSVPIQFNYSQTQEWLFKSRIKLRKVLLECGVWITWNHHGVESPWNHVISHCTYRKRQFCLMKNAVQYFLLQILPQTYNSFVSMF